MKWEYGLCLDEEERETKKTLFSRRTDMAFRTASESLSESEGKAGAYYRDT